MKQTFEEFLQEIHFKLHPQLLDDDITDSYDNWISNKDIQDLIEWAELWGKQCYLDGKEEMLSK